MSRISTCGLFAGHDLSLDNLHATHVKVPCRTLVVLKGFGYLDPSLGKEDLPAGVELDLPLWAVKPLLRKGYMSVRIPSKYNRAHRNVLKADATVVDLNRMSSNFYQCGIHLARLPTADAEDIADVLPEVFRSRLMKMVDSYYFTKDSKTTVDSGVSVATATSSIKESDLDLLEKTILTHSRKGSQLLSEYFRR